MLIAISALAVAAATTAPLMTAEPCAPFEIGAPVSASQKRAISARDLAEIADIGAPNAHEGDSPFGVSPDGKWIAFVVRRANPDANRYCQRLLVAPLSGGGGARELDRGGELVRDRFELRHLGAVRSGIPSVITPRWSPDGRTLAYLKQEGGSAQIWTVPAAGGIARQATNLAFEIENFQWAEDGDGFVVAGRPRITAEEASIREEAKSGYLYDARFSPMIADHPLPLGTFSMEYFHVGDAGAVRSADAREVARIDLASESDRPKGALLFARSASGARAWSEPTSEALFAPRRLRMIGPDGKTATCELDACTSVLRLAWSKSGNALYFLARTGWARSDTALYRWRASDPDPRKILETADALVGCEVRETEMVCAREGARTSRRLVAINLEHGKSRTIFDPNPHFVSLRLGEVRRLRYKTQYGVESYSDLVLPPGARPGDKHPLVVVQYRSEGFLRGGTGDEVPIHVLAGRGFAVLSFHRPNDAPGTETATNEIEYRRLARRDWIVRRNVQSALEAGIEAAIATGLVDPDRLGISGFSEGTSATQWALINSRLFKVAALGVCCEDKWSLGLYGGIDYENYLRDMGQSLYDEADPEYWAPFSLLQNVDAIDVPILVQTGEYKIGLDVLEAFRRRGKPMEMFVFENEPHVMWQPAHRLAMYDRFVDWFAFWLKEERDCDPTKDARYRRWQAMRGAPVLTTRCNVDGSGPT